jgi:hypothetical protein
MRSPKLTLILVAAVALVVGFTGGFSVALASGGFEYQATVNAGLVNAADAVLKNLLGSSAASIRGFNPQPDPPRVMVHLNADSLIETQVVLFLPPSPIRSSCQNVALISVGNGAVSLTRDTDAAIELHTADLNLGALPPGPICPATEIVPGK